MLQRSEQELPNLTPATLVSVDDIHLGAYAHLQVRQGGTLLADVAAAREGQSIPFTSSGRSYVVAVSEYIDHALGDDEVFLCFRGPL